MNLSKTKSEQGSALKNILLMGASAAVGATIVYFAMSGPSQSTASSVQDTNVSAASTNNTTSEVDDNQQRYRMLRFASETAILQAYADGKIGNSHLSIVASAARDMAITNSEPVFTEAYLSKAMKGPNDTVVRVLLRDMNITN